MKKLYLSIGAVIALDQLTKWFLLVHVGMAERPPIEVTSFFRLVMVWNKGISFGMFNSGEAFMPWLLMLVAVAISAWLFVLARASTICHERLAYGLIIGGALGNVIDRLRFRAVADFFYFHIGDLGWPAFNIADAAICIGVGLLLLFMFRHTAKP
jgi:signal peptidase II